MIDFIRVKIAWITACLLVWFSYSALQVEVNAKAGKKFELVFVPEKAVALRDPNTVRPHLRDPFLLDAPRLLAEFEGPTDDLRPLMSLTEVGPWLQRWGDEIFAAATPFVSSVDLGMRMREVYLNAQGATQQNDKLPKASFALKLEAVSRYDGVPSARLNGMSFSEGDIIPGLDEAWPPRVELIEGVRVHVRHRGEVLMLDLDGKAELHVGEPPAAAGAGSGTRSQGIKQRQRPRKGAGALTPRQKARENR